MYLERCELKCCMYVVFVISKVYFFGLNSVDNIAFGHKQCCAFTSVKMFANVY